jgi:secondary thiamine-phosphate synthase enzyme
MLAKDDWLLDAHGCPGFLRSEERAHIERNSYIHHTEYFHVRIPKRYALVNITEIVADGLERSKVKDGLCLVSAMHITAGIYINDAESGLLSDISGWLENLAPFGQPYRHHQTGEDNGDAHLKSFLTNHEILVPVTGGKCDFGTWQQIFYAEFDGKREKRILLKIMGIG